MTDAKWDRIEACAVENWSKIWKAQEEEYDLKEKKKNIAHAAKEKKERSAAMKDGGRTSLGGKSTGATALVGVRRSARGLV